MGTKIKGLLIALLIVSVGGYFAAKYIPIGHDHKDEQKQLYTCPMHPQIVQDKPGDCPICGMKLVPLKKDDKASVKKAKRTIYRSSMNPNETSDRPGKDSMGMEMVPFEVKDGDENSPVGLAPVSISKEKRELIGISFGDVEMRNISREIRTSVRIVPDETRMHKVTTKVNGWVEKLYVNQTGQFVSKGSPLMSIYSPEILSAQQEYLSAIKSKEKFSNDPGMAASIGEIEKAAAERLRLLDISHAQIEKIKTTGMIERAVTLVAPSSGYVSEKMVLQGQKIAMNDALMVIVDLSRVWGEIDIYETDLPYVKVGMTVEVTLSYWAGKLFKGKISFLNPFLSQETRTMKARIEIPNKDVVLKPNMYGDAKLTYSVGVKLTVPEKAVMRTGVRDYVFIEGRGDLIVPYEIKVGVRSTDGYYEVISGIKEFERVVTSANFLVDSESSLKAALKEAGEGHKH